VFKREVKALAPIFFKGLIDTLIGKVEKRCGGRPRQRAAVPVHHVSVLRAAEQVIRLQVVKMNLKQKSQLQPRKQLEGPML
jgi:hypothetical protein